MYISFLNLHARGLPGTTRQKRHVAVHFPAQRWDALFKAFSYKIVLWDYKVPAAHAQPPSPAASPAQRGGMTTLRTQ